MCDQMDICVYIERMKVRKAERTIELVLVGLVMVIREGRFRWFGYVDYKDVADRVEQGLTMKACRAR